jgi:aspartate 1-decarboxylase
MFRTMLKSKIHRARVTEADLDYEGSLTIDQDLMDAADLLPYEAIDIYDITNGARLTTYAICGERGSGTICVNGAAAHLVKKGDLIIIVCYARYDQHEAWQHQPRIVLVDQANRPAAKRRPA